MEKTGIRTADQNDFEAVCALYEKAHTCEEEGLIHTGWKRGIYPDENTVRSALARHDLFVYENEGKIACACVINRIQPEEYRRGSWRYEAEEEEVMVLHTLFADPDFQHKGIGRAMIAFYEDYAKENGCAWLRIDTNAVNAKARALYAKLGYEERGVVPTVFNGIEGVQLVLLEKQI